MTKHAQGNGQDTTSLSFKSYFSTGIVAGAYSFSSGVRVKKKKKSLALMSQAVARRVKPKKERGRARWKSWEVKVEGTGQV